YDTWYPKEELREIIHNVINKMKNFEQQNSEKYLKIVDIIILSDLYSQMMIAQHMGRTWFCDYYFIRFIFPNDDCLERYLIVKLS
ncbi:16138_t:CDS:2, partial [Funneliformis caledonium]